MNSTPIMRTPINARRCSLTLGFKEHVWGSWRNKVTGQYHSICCSRCGLWWGDFVRKYPALAHQERQQNVGSK